MTKFLPRLLLVLMHASAMATNLTTNSPSTTSCKRALARADAIRLGNLRALKIPAQLGFVRERNFSDLLANAVEILTEEIHPDQDHPARHWTAKLDWIYPQSASHSIAQFSAVNAGAQNLGTHLPPPDKKVLRVTFDQKTGRIISSRFSADASPAPLTDVSFDERRVKGLIDQNTRDLVLRLQGRPYLTEESGDRAEDHRVMKVIRAFHANELSKFWVEVTLRVLIESPAGGLHSEKFNLVYAVSPDYEVRLAAADDDRVTAMIGR